MIHEMTQYPQWVCWKSTERDGKATKVPYCPRTGRMASVKDPSSWGSYADAANAMARYDGIGFVLTENDPFCFIDLDDTDDPEQVQFQREIFTRIQTYAEWSPSGKGLHLICHASVGKGVRRGSVEIYDRERYMTVTHNPYRNVPIENCNEVVNALVDYLNPQRNLEEVAIVDDIERYSDDQVLGTAERAVNGEKFKHLWAGDWTRYYHSQSEADMALMNIIAFYTDSKEQCRRLFFRSALGQRKKAHDHPSYVSDMINKAFDRKVPNMQIALIQNVLSEVVAEEHRPQEAYTTADEIECPPGLLGDLSRFIYEISPRPVPEVALATAIAIMCGITGRAWNVSKTGLNQYIFLIGKTGIGKDGINVGVSAIQKELLAVLPTAKCFFGPSEIASPQALQRYFGEGSSSFFAYSGEIGHLLQEMTRPNPSPAMNGLKRYILSLYQSSGNGKVLQGMIYADKDKNVAKLTAPAFTWFGESTPGKFYGSLEEGMISEGLIPRFLVIETRRERPPLNQNHAGVKPSPALLGKLSQIAAHAMMLNQGDKAIDVQFSPEGEDILGLSGGFSRFCDDKINSDDSDIRRELWNRAHLKAMKLAALVAVCNNYLNPVIDEVSARWAIKVVMADIQNMLVRFDSGEIVSGDLEGQQIDRITNAIKTWLTEAYEVVERFAPQRRAMHAKKIVPYGFIHKVVHKAACFKNDRNGATFALKRALRTLCERGELAELPQATAETDFGTNSICYYVRNASIVK